MLASGAVRGQGRSAGGKRIAAAGARKLPSNFPRRRKAPKARAWTARGIAIASRPTYTHRAGAKPRRSPPRAPPRPRRARANAWRQAAPRPRATRAGPPARSHYRQPQACARSHARPWRGHGPADAAPRPPRRRPLSGPAAARRPARPARRARAARALRRRRARAASPATQRPPAPPRRRRRRSTPRPRPRQRSASRARGASRPTRRAGFASRRATAPKTLSRCAAHVTPAGSTPQSARPSLRGAARGARPCAAGLRSPSPSRSSVPPTPAPGHHPQGLELFQRIGAVAEAEGHHPDLALEVGAPPRPHTPPRAAPLPRAPIAPTPPANDPDTRARPACPSRLRRQGWNNVTVTLWTHERGGLTEADFAMASKVDAVDKADLISRKPPLPW
jgi:hypothetical protein